MKIVRENTIKEREKGEGQLWHWGNNLDEIFRKQNEFEDLLLREEIVSEMIFVRSRKEYEGMYLLLIRFRKKDNGNNFLRVE